MIDVASYRLGRTTAMKEVMEVLRHNSFLTEELMEHLFDELKEDTSLIDDLASLENNNNYNNSMSEL